MRLSSSALALSLAAVVLSGGMARATTLEEAQAQLAADQAKLQADQQQMFADQQAGDPVAIATDAAAVSADMSAVNNDQLLVAHLMGTTAATSPIGQGLTTYNLTTSELGNSNTANSGSASLDPSLISSAGSNMIANFAATSAAQMQAIETTKNAINSYTNELSSQSAVYQLAATRVYTGQDQAAINNAQQEINYYCNNYCWSYNCNYSGDPSSSPMCQQANSDLASAQAQLDADNAAISSYQSFMSNTPSFNYSYQP